jgi:hypothetical protein
MKTASQSSQASAQEFHNQSSLGVKGLIDWLDWLDVIALFLVRLLRLPYKQSCNSFMVLSLA